MTTARSIQLFAKDIKLAHSVFALPFALSALTFLSFDSFNATKIVLIIGCMVSARSFAMGMNRYLDRNIDGKNPRTLQRMIPAKMITPLETLSWSLIFGAIFVLLSFQLSKLAGFLSLPMLLILAGYSLQKHVTWLCHFYLGLCLGFAPIAVDIAISGTASPEIMFVGLGVALWTAGFDVIYSLQDRDFDSVAGLNSVPQKFGYSTAINISRACFFGMIASLGTAGYLGQSGKVYFVGLTTIAGVLFVEHYLIRDAKNSGHSKYLNKAFFDFNAFVSVFFLAVAIADVLLK